MRFVVRRACCRKLTPHIARPRARQRVVRDALGAVGERGAALDFVHDVEREDGFDDRAQLRAVRGHAVAERLVRLEDARRRAVVPLEQLDAEVGRLASSIIAKSPVAVATGKRMFYPQLEAGLEDAYRQAADAMACNMMAEDAGEGIDAFMAKRPAVWKGR